MQNLLSEVGIDMSKGKGEKIEAGIIFQLDNVLSMLRHLLNNPNGAVLVTKLEDKTKLIVFFTDENEVSSTGASK